MEEYRKKDIHIDAIRRRFGITLAAVSRYNNLNRNEIINSGEIFGLQDSRGETQFRRTSAELAGREKLLTLLYLISPGGQKSVIRKFREEMGLNDPQYNAEPLIKKHGALLVAAMIYDPRFYAMAINYHGAVSAGLPFTDSSAAGQSGGGPSAVKEHSRYGSGRVISFPVRSRLALAAAAVFIAVFFIAILNKNGGITGRRINNDWISGLTAPEKAQDGIAFAFDGNEGARIGIKSPLVGAAMSSDGRPANVSAAVEYYTKAIRKEKGNAALYVNRGIAYTLQGYIDLALRDFDKALELDPNNTSAHFNRAIAYAGRSNSETAIAALTAITDRNPNDSEAYYALGVLYFRQYENDPAKPKVLLERAIDAFLRIQGYKDANIIFDYLTRLLQP